MVGLYLRSQGEFVLWDAADGSGGPTASEWLYYQIGAVALLPELWRWSGIQAAAPQPAAPDALGSLTGTLLLRVVRALRTRDSFHRAFNLPQRRDAARTGLAGLDTILVMLLGAVDASARFIHVLLAVQGEPRYAGWQNEGWRSKLAGQGQPLTGLFGNGAPLADVLTILRHLRNTVHGQAIKATMRQNGRIRDAPITLPAGHEKQILASMDNLGGRAAWGVPGQALAGRWRLTWPVRRTVVSCRSRTAECGDGRDALGICPQPAATAGLRAPLARLVPLENRIRVVTCGLRDIRRRAHTR
jgi:hypothetical protein